MTNRNDMRALAALMEKLKRENERIDLEERGSAE